jgi:hypothetical protein
MLMYVAFLLQALAAPSTSAVLPDGPDTYPPGPAEVVPELVAQPQWGSFFAHGELYDGFEPIWTADERLPPFRIALALPPPFKGELLLRQLGAGPWSTSAADMLQYSGDTDGISFPLPLEASWRISRAGTVLAKGRILDSSVHFSRDDIIVYPPNDNTGYVERFPIAPETWAKPSVLDVEDDPLDFWLYQEFLDALHIDLKTMANAPDPWPSIALNLAVAAFVKKDHDFSETERTRALSLLKLIKKRLPATRKPEAQRWIHRLSMFHETLSAKTAEIHFSPDVRELRVNGKTVFRRGRSKMASSHRVPVPRSGLGYVEVFEDVYYANDDIHAVHREAAWVPLLAGMQLEASMELRLRPSTQRLADTCVVVQMSRRSEGAGWSMEHYGTSTRHAAVGQPLSLPNVSVEVYPPGSRSGFDLWSGVPGTATFTVDEHGAVSGAFDPSDRCAP